MIKVIFIKRYIKTKQYFSLFISSYVVIPSPECMLLSSPDQSWKGWVEFGVFMCASGGTGVLRAHHGLLKSLCKPAFPQNIKSKTLLSMFLNF
jgi:hypothetical protein